MSNSLLSRLKELANFIIFEKEDNLSRYTIIFEIIFLEISVAFDFYPEISGILVDSPISGMMLTCFMKLRIFRLSKPL